jgi:hypothetical protein
MMRCQMQVLLPSVGLQAVNHCFLDTNIEISIIPSIEFKEKRFRYSIGVTERDVSCSPAIKKRSLESIACSLHLSEFQD